jgi:hypothetical protein
VPAGVDTAGADATGRDAARPGLFSPVLLW